MLEWLFENKEWLFEGAAVAIPIALIGWWLSSKNPPSQNLRSGKNSKNIQAGRNVTIINRKENE